MEYSNDISSRSAPGTPHSDDYKSSDNRSLGCQDVMEKICSSTILESEVYLQTCDYDMYQILGVIVFYYY